MLIIDLKPLAFGSGIRFLRDIFLLLPIWPVFPLGRPNFHHLGLRSSGPCWTGHALASSLQALLSPQSSLKSHLNFLRLNSLFADFAPAACLQALCPSAFSESPEWHLTFAKQGLSLLCCSELGAAITAAVTGAFYQWLQPGSLLSALMVLSLRAGTQSPQRVLCSVRWVLQ